MMPQLSDSMTEGKLVSWKVKPGDSVTAGDVIAEVESDKAIIEVQSFKNGTIKTLTLKEGDTVPVGTTIAVIETDTPAPTQKPETKKAEAKESPQLNISTAPKTPTPEPKTQNPKPKAKNTIIDDLFDTNKNQSTIDHRPSTIDQAGTASPKAKALAARYGIDIEALQKEGKLPIPIHSTEVDSYWQRHYFTAKALELIDRYHLSPDSFETGKKHDEEEVAAYIETHNIPLPKPLSLMQKAMIKNVTKAAGKPIYHLYDSLDAPLLKKHETASRTITVWLLKLFGEAMMRHETFRTSLGPNGLQLWPNASISVAMAHNEALYMAVFKDLNLKDIEKIAEEMQLLKNAVKAGSLSPEQMQGSTFGLSNLGMTGIERFDAMINGKDCGIAAVGSDIDGKIAVTLTIDHRIINGYQAAEFMQTLKSLAVDPLFFKE